MKKSKTLIFSVTLMSFLALVIMSQKASEIKTISPWAGSATISNNLYRFGNVAIGTNNPGDFKLAVEGKIGAREIIVQNEDWADFVFDEQYELMPLLKVEEFYKLNKHLPGIPDAVNVKEHGVNVGEMQTKLLQKVEELTLYMVQLQKENEALQERLSKLENQ
ncbi:MAG: hypothetical protein H6627_06290 [Calditrichae bacterium]|nr:hypothetical protein [Calditrichota bacterium]MCB9058158.1 hypothetical protein [Calditrichia bacterium]